MNQTSIILHLSLIDGVGPGTIQKIIARTSKSGCLQDCYHYSIADWQELFCFSRTIAETLVLNLADHSGLDREIRLIEEHDISLMTVQDAMYPECLRHIHLPPPVLYCKGAKLADHKQMLAIIGSRKANGYARHFIKLVVPDLVRSGWSIVSGGALGADSMAHQATLEARGATIAVIGSGLLRAYPRSNRYLFENIITQGGTLVSPFPLTMEALPGNFPARNRIISGLSRGCLVVQAARRSGAAITARFALEQGREVFALPGPLDDMLSAGCHALIQQGATLVTCSEDILQEFQECGAGTLSKQLSLEVTESTLHNRALQTPMHRENMRPQSLILQSCGQPSSVDDLVEKTGLDVAVLMRLLFDMQLEGMVAQNFMGLWERT